MTPRGEPDPRQLRMESLQAMSEAARRADAAGAPRPPPRGPRPPLRRVHGDVSAPHIHGAYIPPPPAEAAEQPPRSLSVCSGHRRVWRGHLRVRRFHQPRVGRNWRPLRVRLHGAAVRQVGANHSSSSPPRHDLTTHPLHYSTTNVNLSMAAYEGWDVNLSQV